VRVDPEVLARRFHDSSGPSEKFDFFPKTGKGILDAAISLRESVELGAVIEQNHTMTIGFKIRLCGTRRKGEDIVLITCTK
jgi:hypothetical protein